jgi:hypothetical protein
MQGQSLKFAYAAPLADFAPTRTPFLTAQIWGITDGMFRKGLMTCIA